MNEENIPVITDREELYDKCENMEQLFDKYYLPLLDKHYSKTYKLQQENKQLQKELEKYKNPIEYFKYANKNVTEENKQLKEINEEHKKLNGELREENKKYKEIIDKAINNSQYWIDYYTRLNSDERIALRLQENIDILKEVE